MRINEKVIKGLECCLPMTTKDGQADCKSCPYDRPITLKGGVCECCHDLMLDALELVKTQIPRSPHYTTLKYIMDGVELTVHHPECPNCYDKGLVLWDAEIERGADYCKRCGQAVKWNEHSC